MQKKEALVAGEAHLGGVNRPERSFPGGKWPSLFGFLAESIMR